MSDDLPEDDPFIDLARAVMQVQGQSMALYHILFELVLRVARGQPDPSGFLKDMYNRISAKLDQQAPETAAKAASGHEQETLSTFFSVLERAVRSGAQRDGRRPRRN